MPSLLELFRCGPVDIQPVSVMIANNGNNLVAIPFFKILSLNQYINESPVYSVFIQHITIIT